MTTISWRANSDCIGAVSLESARHRLYLQSLIMSDPAAAQIDEQVSYDRDGLVPCIVQDWSTGEVLTLAYMNAEALRRTRDTGQLHLWSRSRAQLWHKGETSGNVQTRAGAADRL